MSKFGLYDSGALPAKRSKLDQEFTINDLILQMSRGHPIDSNNPGWFSLILVLVALDDRFRGD